MAVAHDVRIPLQTTIAEAAIRASQPSATMRKTRSSALSPVWCAQARYPLPLRATDCGLVDGSIWVGRLRPERDSPRFCCEAEHDSLFDSEQRSAPKVNGDSGGKANSFCRLAKCGLVDRSERVAVFGSNNFLVPVQVCNRVPESYIESIMSAD